MFIAFYNISFKYSLLRRFYLLLSDDSVVASAIISLSERVASFDAISLCIHNNHSSDQPLLSFGAVIGNNSNESVTTKRKPGKLMQEMRANNLDDACLLFVSQPQGNCIFDC